MHLRAPAPYHSVQDPRRDSNNHPIGSSALYLQGLCSPASQDTRPHRCPRRSTPSFDSILFQSKLVHVLIARFTLSSAAHAQKHQRRVAAHNNTAQDCRVCVPAGDTHVNMSYTQHGHSHTSTHMCGIIFTMMCVRVAPGCVFVTYYIVCVCVCNSVCVCCSVCKSTCKCINSPQSPLYTHTHSQ